MNAAQFVQIDIIFDYHQDSSTEIPLANDSLSTCLALCLWIILQMSNFLPLWKVTL
jgi:hypothetical protein